jgi:hypothetical protein
MVKKCKEIGCEKQPNYNKEGETNGLYCVTHKKPDMIDVKHKICLIPFCEQHRSIDDYCKRCFYNIYPDDKRVKRVKVKEIEVLKYIKENFKDLNIIYDKYLEGDGTCLNKRPDILIHLNFHTLIIEIDEHQHKGYEKRCDEARTHQIQETLNRPVVIIRFNPDGYIDKNNIKWTSCFTIIKKLGLTTINKNQKDLWEKRLEILKNTVIDIKGSFFICFGCF